MPAINPVTLKTQAAQVEPSPLLSRREYCFSFRIVLKNIIRHKNGPKLHGCIIPPKILKYGYAHLLGSVHYLQIFCIDLEFYFLMRSEIIRIEWLHYVS